MESQTKTTLSSETINTLVKTQFGTAIQVKEITPLTAGFFNTAYAIHFENLKPDVVLRVAPHPEQPVLTYEKNLMRREQLILKTIEQLAEIPYVPRLLGHDFSRQLIERDYMFIEKLSGVALQDIKDQLTPENLEEIEFEVGRYIALLGQIKGESFGYPGDGPGHDAPTWRTAFVAMMEAMLNDGEALGALLPVSYAKVREAIYRHAPTLDAIKEPALVHWDLWAGNVFVIPQNGKYILEGIIDWERAMWGDPDIESAVACRFYGPAFYQGYGKQLADEGPEALRQSLYRLFLFAIMLIEVMVRHNEPDYLPWIREQFKMQVDFLQSC